MQNNDTQFPIYISQFFLSLAEPRHGGGNEFSMFQVSKQGPLAVLIENC